MNNVIFKPVFSNDVDYLQSSLVVIEKEGELFGFNCYHDGTALVCQVIDVTCIPVWTDIEDINKYCGCLYNEDIKDDELYNYIASSISYYGAKSFDYYHDIYEVESDDYKSFDNQEFVNLLFGEYVK